MASHGKYWRPSKLGFVNDAAFCPSSNSVTVVAPAVDHLSWTLVGALQLTVLGPVKLTMRTPFVCAVVVVVAWGTDVLGAGDVVLVVVDDPGAVDVGAAELGGDDVVVVSVFLALLLQAARRRSVRIRARRITGRAIVGPS